MKGFVLEINKERISGAIDEGITGIILTCKNGQCHVDFGSMNKSGMFSYTWYASDLEKGDCLNIRFEDIANVSEAKETRDFNISSEDSARRDLETYRRLKAELIE